jgi:hypothetical protein
MTCPLATRKEGSGLLDKIRLTIDISMIPYIGYDPLKRT